MRGEKVCSGFVDSNDSRIRDLSRSSRAWSSRHRPKVYAANQRKVRSQTVNHNSTSSNVKSTAKQFKYNAVTKSRIRQVATMVKCEAVPPFRCVNGQRVGRPLKKARPPRVAASRVPVLQGFCRGFAPWRKCSGPSTFRAPGASSGEVAFCLPGRRPGRSGNSDRKKPLSESSDADQTRPPAHRARVAIEATKPRLRSGRIGSCLSDCLVSDLSFDQRSPGQ